MWKKMFFHNKVNATLLSYLKVTLCRFLYKISFNNAQNFKIKFLCVSLIMMCTANYASCSYLDNIQLLQPLTVTT